MRRQRFKQIASRRTERRFAKVRILFEDEVLLVVDKPARLLTIATAAEKQETLYACLYDHVKQRRPPEKIFVVHRLDRDASGLLVFAKTPQAKQNLQRQFSERRAGRVYKAMVEGRIEAEAGTIRSTLAENTVHRSYSTADQTAGKEAVTHFRVVRRFSDRSLLEVRLETGRKHQIRVHMAERGHPVLGDKAYGSRLNPLHRLALHAESLTFKHPVTGQRMEFLSPSPFK